MYTCSRHIITCAIQRRGKGGTILEKIEFRKKLEKPFCVFRKTCLKEVSSYNDKVPSYNDKVPSYNNKVSSYNNKVSSYNDKVPTYNDKVSSYKETSHHKAVIAFHT